MLHSITRIRFVLFALLAFVATAVGCASPGPEGGPGGDDLGAADGFGDPEANDWESCPDMVGVARQALIDQGFEESVFNDEVAFARRIDDLNGDGVRDALAYPGYSYTGPNVALVVFLSNGVSCFVAGIFSGAGVEPGVERSHGALDLFVDHVGQAGCEVTRTRYVFQEGYYYEHSVEVENICGGPQPSETIMDFIEDECATDCVSAYHRCIETNQALYPGDAVWQIASSICQPQYAECILDKADGDMTRLCLQESVSPCSVTTEIGRYDGFCLDLERHQCPYDRTESGLCAGAGNVQCCVPREREE